MDPKDARQVPAGHDHSIDRRKIKVDDGDVEVARSHLPDCLQSVRGRLDLVPFGPEPIPQPLPTGEVMLHDQNPLLHCERLPRCRQRGMGLTTSTRSHRLEEKAMPMPSHARPQGLPALLWQPQEACDVALSLPASYPHRLGPGPPTEGEDLHVEGVNVTRRESL